MSANLEIFTVIFKDFKTSHFYIYKEISILDFMQNFYILPNSEGIVYLNLS